MPIETECKLRVDSHTSIRFRLRRTGGAYDSTVLEFNRMFDRPDASLRGERCGLRIRECRLIDRAAAAGVHTADSAPALRDRPPSQTDPAATPAMTAQLTFKGPPHAGPYKSREEIEFAISDAAAAARVLVALGFVETLSFEKRREHWRLGDCSAELDELPHLGSFVEVEGPDDSAVRQALQSLELDMLPPVTETYAALLEEHCRSQGLSCSSLRLV